MKTKKHENKKTKLILKLLLFFLLAPISINAATIQTGDLVKTENSSSVYQIQDDQTRRVFPDEVVYGSYYDNFDTVKTISAEELKIYRFAGNISLKVGTLVKFNASNRVYEVKFGNELEWIKTEEGFNNLGYDFSDVVGLPEIYFGDYKVRVVDSSYDEVLDKIRSSFVDQDKAENIDDVAGSAKGLVEALDDQYSVFWTAEEYQEFLDWINNDSFEGIGAQIEVRDDWLTIVAPLEGSPAQAAGLKAGDRVKYIDDYDAFGIDINKAVMLIRGEKGTTVVLKVFRNSSSQLISIPITRDTIVVPQFSWEVKQTPAENNVVYMDISQFSLAAWQDFSESKDEILAVAPDGMILDLRNNPGGYLEMALDVASRWLQPNQSVLSETKADDVQITHVSNSHNYYLDLPLVILINQGSASASEIVAGALQDNGVTTLVGEQTFGKGVVQQIMQLSDGNVIKLTVSEWFTPDGNQINGIGITPDVVVELDDEVEGDEQMIRAMEELDGMIVN